jgi:hypothetical protein
MRPPDAHRAPSYRVERLGVRGWEEVAPAWSILQACRILTSRRGYLETVRIWDVYRKCEELSVKPGDDWEYEIWR